VEFEKNLLLSLISTQIWLVPHVQVPCKAKKIPWFHNGKIIIKRSNISPALPLESFAWVLLIQLQFVRGFHYFPCRECYKNFLGFVRYNCKLQVSTLRIVTLQLRPKTSRLGALFPLETVIELSPNFYFWKTLAWGGPSFDTKILLYECKV
jgi:hypothetical protein